MQRITVWRAYCSACGMQLIPEGLNVWVHLYPLAPDHQHAYPPPVVEELRYWRGDPVDQMTDAEFETALR